MQAEGIAKMRTKMLVITIICCICMAAGNLWGLFGADLAEMNGWNHFQASLPFVVSNSVGCFTGILGGMVSDSKSPGKLTALGSLSIGTGLVFLGLFKTSLPMVVFSQGFLLIACQTFASVGLVSAAMKWFPMEQKNRASGLASLGMSMSSAITAFLYQAVTGRLGFSAGMCVLGILYGGTGAVLAWNFRPAPVNASQSGSAGAAPVSAAAPACVIYKGITRKDAIRTPEFLMIVVSFCLSMSANLAINSQTVLIIRSYAGTAFPSWLFVAIGALGGITARLTAAMIGDRIGTFRLWRSMAAVFACCLLAFPFAGSIWIMLALYVIQQFCINSMIVCHYAAYALIFDSACTGFLTGLGSTGYYIAGIVAPAAAGLISDRAGSYTPVFLGLAVVEAATVLLLTRLGRKYAEKLGAVLPGTARKF